MLRQELASSPRTYEHLRLKVLLEFGFTAKFVNEFLEVHKEAIVNEGGYFKWKA